MKPGSKGWKKFMAKLYGFGAAVVIVGALFKIMHWPGADAMLIAGLGTEALIFFISVLITSIPGVVWYLE
jgi:gliding motility-associated protein GldL